MNKKLIISALLAPLVLIDCSAKSSTQENVEKLKTVNVEAKVLHPQTFERYLRIIGTVKSEKNIQLSAEVTGRIERYYIEEGDFVEKGEAILKINDDKLKKRIAKLKAQATVAQERYQRLKRLYVEENIGSKINVIKARTAYKKAKAALEALKVDLVNTTVRAPYSGVVNNIITEAGEMAAPGTPLVRLIAVSDINISAGVPSRYANAIAKGEQARVWFEFQSTDTLKLPITYVSRTINEESRTFDIEIALPASVQHLKIDMKANIKIRTFKQDSAIVISRQYIYPSNDQYIVYTVAQNEKGELVADRQVVKPGPAYNDKVLIKSGLKAGDKLITTGSAFLQDQMRVNLAGTENE